MHEGEQMAETDTERLERARTKFNRTDAHTLRTIAHGWIGLDELILVNPGGVARQILMALDALAIVHDNEAKTAEQDQVMKEVNDLEIVSERQTGEEDAAVTPRLTTPPTQT